MAGTKKVELHLAGPKTGLPTFEDILVLFKQLTGRDPTPQEVQDAKKAWEAS